MPGTASWAFPTPGTVNPNDFPHRSVQRPHASARHEGATGRADQEGSQVDESEQGIRSRSGQHVPWRYLLGSRRTSSPNATIRLVPGENLEVIESILDDIRADLDLRLTGHSRVKLLKNLGVASSSETPLNFFTRTPVKGYPDTGQSLSKTLAVTS
ncbi:hypothetical protein [Paeniglutamicibacter sulfureus]|uniref:Uncharacterized protein n=1 Tax=Paeniglutamicibacter sulfureus TaxID=43666 RepID=A0ABU2BG30_9MICC|nr:hypothetical protein [Paeniglutamicibacter sulfureus]MDR7357593.1 hypothetical protein [Paeniglutamicibacter sulfureus]